MPGPTTRSRRSATRRTARGHPRRSTPRAPAWRARPPCAQGAPGVRRALSASAARSRSTSAPTCCDARSPWSARGHSRARVRRTAPNSSPITISRSRSCSRTAGGSMRPMPPTVCSIRRPRARASSCREADRGLTPGKHWLLQVGYAGDAALDELGELIKHGRRRGVQPAAVDAEPDQAPVALGNGTEIGGIAIDELGQWYAVDGRDLAGIEAELPRYAGPHHHRGDEVARPRRIVVEQTQDVLRPELEANLLAQFTQGCRRCRLALLTAAARQRPLA